MSSHLKKYLKYKLDRRKGLLNVIKTYKTKGPVEGFIELTFLILDRLKINSGKFIISQQAIYLYGDSKHLRRLEKFLLRKKNTKDKLRTEDTKQNNLLNFEEI